MLKLRFSSAAHGAAWEAAWQAFRFEAGILYKHPEGEPVARYSGGQWWIGRQGYLNIDCPGPAILRLGDTSLGPFAQVRLVDGVLLGDEKPLATMHPQHSWIAGDERWPRLVIEAAGPD